jgi:hypothetical protein
MSHSFSDGSKRIAFHPRLLSDFKNIYELGLKIHEALDAEPRGASQKRCARGHSASQWHHKSG